jgi:hypothetical protein
VKVANRYHPYIQVLLSSPQNVLTHAASNSTTATKEAIPIVAKILSSHEVRITSTFIMSESPPGMTFAEKTMLKMGQKQSQGLSKNGEGIFDPVRDSGNVGRTGIGYENIAPKPSTDGKTYADQEIEVQLKEPISHGFASMETLPKSDELKDKLKLFVGNMSGLTEAEIYAAVHPIAILDVQINSKGFSFASLDASDAVELVAKYSLDLALLNGGKIYFCQHMRRRLRKKLVDPLPVEV